MTTPKKADAKPEVPSKAEIDEAKKEGILDAVRESASTADIDRQATEGELTGPRFFNLFGTNQLEHLTDMGLEALEDAIDPKGDEPLDENVIANLLALERNGKNRTDFVKLLMKRLKISGLDQLRTDIPWAGGPDYTNDVTAISKL